MHVLQQDLAQAASCIARLLDLIADVDEAERAHEIEAAGLAEVEAAAERMRLHVLDGKLEGNETPVATDAEAGADDPAPSVVVPAEGAAE